MRGVDYKASPWVTTIDTRLFEVRASILFKFSSSLITDETQALRE